VLAHRRLADLQFLGDEQPADAVRDEVAVHLGWEVRLGILEPVQDLHPALVRQRLHHTGRKHIANLPFDE
jgi:hypothetical protein